jgi:quercetin dioxygenase-like cupin family protein
MSNLVDFSALPVLDLWGETVRGRRLDGERITMALVELAPDAVVPGHQHQNEQMGLCITGRLTFTIGDEVRELGPGGTWRIPPGVYHQVTVGSEGASVIDIFAPVRSDWDGLPEHPPAAPVWPVTG